MAQPKKGAPWSRREVLAGAAVGAGAVVLPIGLTGCETGEPPDEPAQPPPALTDNLVLPEAVVALARSARETAAEIGDDDVAALVREAIEQAGGLASIVSDGNVVVLKPNLITSHDYTLQSATLEPHVNGITTDRRLVRAVSEIVREINPSGEILLMEGAADDTTSYNMLVLGYEAGYFPEIDELIALEDASGGWHEWDSPLLTTATLPAGVGRYPDAMKPNEGPEFYLNRRYAEADVVISLPCLKTHGNSTITGAVKNLGIGATPTSIYGGAEGDNHRYINGVINHDYDHLQQFIHDYFLCRPADFVVMDGLQGLQNGPVCSNFSTSITQDQMNMRMVLAGRDAVAVDAVAALVMGFDPVKLELLRWLQESGGGVCDPLAVRVAGPPLDEVRTEFASWGEETASERNTDLDPPVLTIHTAEVDGDVLVLDVELDEPGRLEIALDGERLDGHVLQDLDHVVIDIGHLAAGDHTLTLTALDEALNATSEERTITVG